MGEQITPKMEPSLASYSEINIRHYGFSKLAPFIPRYFSCNFPIYFLKQTKVKDACWWNKAGLRTNLRSASGAWDLWDWNQHSPNRTHVNPDRNLKAGGEAALTGSRPRTHTYIHRYIHGYIHHHLPRSTAGPRRASPRARRRPRHSPAPAPARSRGAPGSAQGKGGERGRRRERPGAAATAPPPLSSSLPGLLPPKLFPPDGTGTTGNPARSFPFPRCNAAPPAAAGPGPGLGPGPGRGAGKAPFMPRQKMPPALLMDFLLVWHVVPYK